MPVGNSFAQNYSVPGSNLAVVFGRPTDIFGVTIPGLAAAINGATGIGVLVNSAQIYTPRGASASNVTYLDRFRANHHLYDGRSGGNADGAAGR